MAKIRFALSIDPNIARRARNAAFWTQGLTLTGLVERSLRQEIERLEEERGEPFPERTGELQRGKQ